MNDSKIPTNTGMIISPYFEPETQAPTNTKYSIKLVTENKNSPNLDLLHIVKNILPTNLWSAQSCEV